MTARPRFAVAPADSSPVFYELSEGDLPSGERQNGRPALVLSDGVGCDGFIWKYLRRSLADHRVVHWNYRGHGRTPAPRDARRITIPDFADDLIAVLDDCGAGQAVLFGHSMGVQVSLETFRRHRDRVAGLVLVCGAPGTPLRTFNGHDLLERALPAMRKVVGAAPGLLGRAWRRLVPTNLSFDLARLTELNGALVEREDMMPYLEGMARIDPQLFLAVLDQANQHDAEDLLGHVDVPTLIIAGDRDGFTPPELSKHMHQSIPDSELLLVEGGSHTAPIERPHLIERTVREFLARRLDM